MKEWMQGVPEMYFDEDSLTTEEVTALLAETATVAQKCTGRAKKPVFLFPEKVVKGPWYVLLEKERLNRELGRATLMRSWAMSTTICAVLKPTLFAEEENQRVYLVTPALYPKPTDKSPWVIEAECRNVSAVGPRFLRVVDRTSTGVVRVSDRVKKDPDYILHHVEIWEHLIHRCILSCGDSGLHNMMVDPTNDSAVGVDLDEMRNTKREDPNHWMTLLFKSPPAKALQPLLIESIMLHQEQIQAILNHLSGCCFTESTDRILREHRLERDHWRERIEWLQGALKMDL